LAGQPISSLQKQWSVVSGQWPVVSGQAKVENESVGAPAAPPATVHCPLSTGHCVWLDLPRAGLYALLNPRGGGVCAAGLVEEARALRQLPRPVSREAAQALGYKEVFAHLDGRATLAETITEVQTRSRQYAKRQISWFRHLPECRPVSKELTATLWIGKMSS